MDRDKDRLNYDARIKLERDFLRYCRVCARQPTPNEFLVWLQDVRRVRFVLPPIEGEKQE